jgi:parallel beta-helix repeat protein
MFVAQLFVTTILLSGCIKDIPFHFRDIYVHEGESIQAAVNAARPGQTIYIKPGTYKESVVIKKKGIHIIGLNDAHGHGVIIDNPGTEANGITVQDNGNEFLLKNVTVRNFKKNGVYLTGIENFLLIEVITENNGEYGLFPVLCRNGVIKNCSATGHTDTGIYVGQSKDILVALSKAFGNVNGLEIENSTDVTVYKNESYNNTAGLLVILLPGLDVKTSSNILVNENDIHDNNLPNFAPPGGGFEIAVPKGSGVLIVGADNVSVKKNEISNNNFVGIAVVSTLVLGTVSGLPPEVFNDIEPNADGTRIKNNVLINNGTVPPALPFPAVDLLWDGTGVNNCWKDNQFSTSYPPNLPTCS